VTSSGGLVGWERRDPSARKQKPHLAVGNGLTFDDWLGEEFGKRRFYYNEGFNGALVTRFKLGAGKRYFRTLEEARLEIAMVMCAISISICSIERYERAGGALALAA
jgi:hypothetical protein